jgi:hypothetical protein
MRIGFLVAPFVLFACHVSPAAKSPLKEKLAPLSEVELQQATTACLEKTGWTVDPFPSEHGELRRLHAKKNGLDASLYLYPKGTTPRITGDLAEDGHPIWACLEASLH